VHKEEIQVHKEPQDQQVQQVLKVEVERQELKVIQEDKVLKEEQEQQVLFKGPQVHKVHKDQ
jgi:hypothetical protein